MSESILLVFDLSAILAGRTRDWSQFNSVGSCFIPQVVMEEIEFLTQRSSDPEEEKIAREFTRFLPDSNWEISQSIAEHPSLTPPDGKNLSKNARLQLAVAQCVYGMTQENTASIVVMVSNQGNLRTQLENLKVNNLCTLTSAQFIQWLRTNQRPLNITQAIQKQSVGGWSPTSQSPNPQIDRPKQGSTKTGSSSSQSQSRTPRYSTSVKKANPISGLINSILALVAFTAVGCSIWYFAQPKSFNQFWQKLGLPPISNQ
jgi:hypothetical protein